MAEGKYIKVGGAIKEVIGEYCKVGGAIVEGTINAIDVDGIKEIGLADRYAYSAENVNDEVYRITDAGVEDWHADYTDGKKVCVNSEGESYWAIGTGIKKLYADGSLAWSYSAEAYTIQAICVENRSGVLYVYFSDTEGHIVCVRDDGGSVINIWSVNVDITYSPPVYALAVDTANGFIYAGVGFQAESIGVWRAAVSTGTFVRIYISAEDISSLAVDTDGKIYVGDSVGNYRKMANSGYVYWTKTLTGVIASIEIAHNGYGYLTCESEKKVYKFTPSTGVKIWSYTPSLASFAYDCAVDAGGNVYVVFRNLAASPGNYIYKVNKEGGYVLRFQSYVDVKFYGMAVTPGIEAAGF